jgi:hypothetical protein
MGRDLSGETTPPDAVNGVSGTATHIAVGNYHTLAIVGGPEPTATPTPTPTATPTGPTATPSATPTGPTPTPTATPTGPMPTPTATPTGPTPTPTATPTAAPPRPPGSVVGWGDDYYGQAIPPDDVNGVLGTATHIAAGRRHSCAIQAGTGNVVCWGYDGKGRATPPDDVNGVSGTATDIAAGEGQKIAIALPEPSSWLLQVAGICFLAVLYRVRGSSRESPTQCLTAGYLKGSPLALAVKHDATGSGTS